MTNVPGGCQPGPSRRAFLQLSGGTVVAAAAAPLLAVGTGVTRQQSGAAPGPAPHHAGPAPGYQYLVGVL